MHASGASAEQLIEMQGTLKLSYPTLADLGCLLTQIDERGCRGSIMFQYLPPEMVSMWKRCLTPNRPVRIKIESHPALGSFEVDGLVSQIAEKGSITEVELKFSNMTPAQTELLRQTVGKGSVAPQHRSALPITPGLTDTHTPAPMPAPAIVQRPQPAQPPAQPPPAPRGIVSAGLGQAANPPVAPRPQIAPAAPPHAVSAPPIPPPPPPSRPQPMAPHAPAAAATPDTGKKRIGSVLSQMGYLSEAQIEEAVKQSRIKGQRLGKYLVTSNLISPDILCRALALQSGLPVTDLSDVEISDEVEKLFPFALLMRHSFVPFDDSAMFVCIAVATPLTAATLKELERTCHKKVEVFLAREDAILKHLNDFRKRQGGSQPRRFLRYDYQASVSYQYCSRFSGPSEETIHTGRTQNVSEGGLMLVGPASALGKPDEVMRRGICVRLTIHNETVPQNEIKALCRFKAIQEKNNLWLMGLELLEISTEDRRRLKELCVRAMMEQLKQKQ